MPPRDRRGSPIVRDLPARREDRAQSLLLACGRPPVDVCGISGSRCFAILRARDRSCCVRHPSPPILLYSTSTGSMCLRCCEQPPGPLIKMRRERLEPRLDPGLINHSDTPNSSGHRIRPPQTGLAAKSRIDYSASGPKAAGEGLSRRPRKACGVWDRGLHLRASSRMRWPPASGAPRTA